MENPLYNFDDKNNHAHHQIHHHCDYSDDTHLLSHQLTCQQVLQKQYQEKHHPQLLQITSVSSPRAQPVRSWQMQTRTQSQSQSLRILAQKLRLHKQQRVVSPCYKSVKVTLEQYCKPLFLSVSELKILKQFNSYTLGRSKLKLSCFILSNCGFKGNYEDKKQQLICILKKLNIPRTLFHDPYDNSSGIEILSFDSFYILLKYLCNNNIMTFLARNSIVKYMKICVGFHDLCYFEQFYNPLNSVQYDIIPERLFGALIILGSAINLDFSFTEFMWTRAATLSLSSLSPSSTLSLSSSSSSSSASSSIVAVAAAAATASSASSLSLSLNSSCSFYSLSSPSSLSLANFTNSSKSLSSLSKLTKSMMSTLGCNSFKQQHSNRLNKKIK